MTLSPVGVQKNKVSVLAVAPREIKFSCWSQRTEILFTPFPLMNAGLVSLWPEFQENRKEKSPESLYQ